jgi:hypothetical protein
MSSEAVRELGLEPGSVAIAIVKATTVIIETPGRTNADGPTATDVANTDNPAHTEKASN